MFTDVATGKLVNSDFLNGLEVAQAKEKIVEYLEEKGIGTAKVTPQQGQVVFTHSVIAARGDSPVSVGI